MDPLPSSRPNIGLLVNFPNIRQVVFDDFRFGAVILLALSLGGGVYLEHSANLTEMTWFGVSQFSNIEWSRNHLVLYIIEAVIVLFLALFLPFIAAFLLGRLSLVRDSLSLDLNGVYYLSPQGKCYTPWQKVFTSCRWRTRWIKLFLEDGGTVLFRVPAADRDWLDQIIRLLLHNHQTELRGKLQPEEPESPLTIGTA